MISKLKRGSLSFLKRYPYPGAHSKPTINIKPGNIFPFSLKETLSRVTH